MDSTGTHRPPADGADFSQRPKREYWCFISYRHADNKQPGRRWAEWLHNALETYEVPADLIGTKNAQGDIIPERIFPIFRDEEELPADAELSKPIEAALRHSRFLVVLCSPQATQSRWVADEILRFKQLGKQDRILAAIIEGEPNSTDDPAKGGADKECFPQALRFALDDQGQFTDERTEPIAADFRLNDGTPGWTTPAAYREVLKAGRLHDHQIAEIVGDFVKHQNLMLLKIVAGVLGIPVGILTARDKAYQLEKARQKARTLRQWLAAVAALTVFAVAGGIAAWEQAQRAEAATATEAHERLLAEIQAESATAQIIAPTRPFDALAKATWAAMKSSELQGTPSPEVLHSLLLSLDGARQVWHVSSERISAMIPLEDRGEVVGLCEADHGGQIKAWDLKRGNVLRARSLEAGTGNAPLTSLAVTDDGRTVMYGRSDGSICFMAGDFSGAITTVKAHKGPVRLIGWSRAKKSFVSVGGEGTVRKWHADGTAEGGTINLTGGVVNVAALNDSCTRLATAHGGVFGTRVQISDLNAPLAEGKTLDFGSARLSSLAVAPDGQTLEAGSDDGFLQQWSIEAQQRLRIFPAHQGVVFAVRFAPDGRSLYSVGEDLRLLRWNLDGRLQETPQAVLGTGGRGRSSIAFAPQAGLVLVTTLTREDGDLFAFDARRLEMMPPVEIGSHVVGVGWSPRGDQLAALDYSGALWLLEANTGHVIHRKTNAVSSGNNAMLAVSAKHDRIALASPSDGKVMVYDWTGRLLEKHVLPLFEGEGLRGLAWCEERGTVWAMTAMARVLECGKDGVAAVEDFGAGTKRRFGAAILVSDAERLVAAYNSTGSSLAGEADILGLQVWDSAGRMRAQGSPPFMRSLVTAPFTERIFAVAGADWPGRIAAFDIHVRRIALMKQVNNDIEMEHMAVLVGISRAECLSVVSRSHLLVMGTEADGVLVLDGTGQIVSPSMLGDERDLQCTAVRGDDAACVVSGREGRLHVFHVGYDAWMGLARQRLAWSTTWRLVNEAHIRELQSWLDDTDNPAAKY